jgi:hypothetical protein
MIRVLAIVAVTGFLMSVVCISAAIAIGGPDIAHGAWTWRNHGGSFGPWRSRRAAEGPGVRREFAWNGDRLEVDAPAEIDYVQAPGAARLVIRGPAWALDRVRVDQGRISLAQAGHWAGHWAPLKITLTAPKVTRFELNGANRLKITGYKQDQLILSANGNAEIEAEGEVTTVTLSVSGAGEADLAALKMAGADIEISGAGAATLGPTEWARVDISGMGAVDLLTRPKRLETNISGAGRIHQPSQDDDREAARPT